MNKVVIRFLVLAASLVFSAYATAASKVVGTCSVKIDGPHPLSFAGKFYEGDVPEGVVQSVVGTRAWMLKNADEIRPHSALLADQRAKLAEELIFVLSLNCASELGRLGLQPYDASAKSADYPSGPKKYRLVGNNTRDKKSGDMAAILMLTGGEGFNVLDPSTPGELSIAQNDGARLVATFNYKSGDSVISGTFDVARPKELAN